MPVFFIVLIVLFLIFFSIGVKSDIEDKKDKDIEAIFDSYEVNKHDIEKITNRLIDLTMKTPFARTEEEAKAFLDDLFIEMFSSKTIDNKPKPYIKNSDELKAVLALYDKKRFIADFNESVTRTISDSIQDKVLPIHPITKKIKSLLPSFKWGRKY